MSLEKKKTRRHYWHLGMAGGGGGGAGWADRWGRWKEPVCGRQEKNMGQPVWQLGPGGWAGGHSASVVVCSRPGRQRAHTGRELGGGMGSGHGGWACLLEYKACWRKVSPHPSLLSHGSTPLILLSLFPSYQHQRKAQHLSTPS